MSVPRFVLDNLHPLPQPPLVIDATLLTPATFRVTTIPKTCPACEGGRTTACWHKDFHHCTLTICQACDGTGRRS